MKKAGNGYMVHLKAAGVPDTTILLDRKKV